MQRGNPQHSIINTKVTSDASEQKVFNRVKTDIENAKELLIAALGAIACIEHSVKKLEGLYK